MHNRLIMLIHNYSRSIPANSRSDVCGKLEILAKKSELRPTLSYPKRILCFLCTPMRVSSISGSVLGVPRAVVVESWNRIAYVFFDMVRNRIVETSQLCLVCWVWQFDITKTRRFRNCKIQKYERNLSKNVQETYFLMKPLCMNVQWFLPDFFNGWQCWNRMNFIRNWKDEHSFFCVAFFFAFSKFSYFKRNKQNKWDIKIAYTISRFVS